MGGIAAGLRDYLAHPLTRGLDLDDPKTTELRRRIVREKPFLKSIYDEWYSALAASVPPGPGSVVELGSGAGYLREFLPDLITTDVFEGSGIDRVVDAREMPFEAGSLRGIVMTNVLHHIPEVERFLADAARCLRPGGVLAMIEPWVTPWSRVVYTKLHHEPFDPRATDWRFPERGPLSGANGALPWIIFQRDRARFERDYPLLKIRKTRPIMPVRYLVSGGISMRSLTPGWSHGLWKAAEALTAPASGLVGMFAHVVVERTA